VVAVDDTSARIIFPTIQFELITPKDAERLLSKMVTNRRLRHRFVKRYARMMMMGKWMEDNPDSPIMIGTDGGVLNGQHRLRAIIITGKSLYMPVAYGVRPQVMRTVDVGAMRSAGDILTVNGKDSGDALAAAAKWLIRYEAAIRDATSLRTIPDITAVEIDDRANANPDLLACTDTAKSLIDLGIVPAAARWLSYEFNAIDVNRAIEFLNAAGNGTDRNDTLATLHKHLVAEVRKGKNGEPQWIRVTFIIKAWNAWLTGRRLTKLMLVKDEKLQPIAGRKDA
jgi:hypothetical protein